MEPNPSGFRTVGQDRSIVDADHNVLHQLGRPQAGEHPHNHWNAGNQEAGLVTLTRSVGQAILRPPPSGKNQSCNRRQGTLLGLLNCYTRHVGIVDRVEQDAIPVLQS